MKKNRHDLYFIDVFHLLWRKKRSIFICTGVFAVVGLILAIGTPSEYTSSVTMAPEGLRNSSGNFSDLAAMAGLEVSMSSRSDAISPTVYPDVISSTPFLVKLSQSQVPVAQKKKTLFDYLSEDVSSPLIIKVVSLPLLVVDGIRSLLPSTGDDLAADTLSPMSAYRLTQKQEKILSALNKRISVAVDKKKRIITASVQMQDPVICAVVADSLVHCLNEYITQYRTQKAKQDYAFTAGLLADAKNNFYQAQARYAQYSDANNNVVKSSVTIERDRLYNEQQLAFGVYSNLSQQLEMAKIRVQEQTPCISILEPPRIPVFKSNMSKAGIVGFTLLLGFALSVLFVLAVNFKSIFRISIQTE